MEDGRQRHPAISVRATIDRWEMRRFHVRTSTFICHHLDWCVV